MPRFAKNEPVTYRDLNDKERRLQLDETFLRHKRGTKPRWPQWFAKWLPGSPIEEMFVEIALVLSIVWFGIAVGFVTCLIWFR